MSNRPDYIEELRQAEEALLATSNEGLLDALLILTHRLHVSRDMRDATLPNPALPGVTHASAAKNENTVRRQRDMVRAEITRRMAQ